MDLKKVLIEGYLMNLNQSEHSGGMGFSILASGLIRRKTLSVFSYHRWTITGAKI
jgi:hypothetical protein